MVKDRDNSTWNAGRDRRQYGRFTSRLPLLTRRDDLVGSGRSRRTAQCRLQMEDFSLGGLRAQSPVPLKVNERLTMRLPQPGARSPLELTGRVVHCHRQEDQYEVGICFCQTRPEAVASPWPRVARLFTVAMESAAAQQ